MDTQISDNKILLNLLHCSSVSSFPLSNHLAVQTPQSSMIHSALGNAGHASSKQGSSSHTSEINSTGQSPEIEMRVEEM